MAASDINFTEFLATLGECRVAVRAADFATARSKALEAKVILVGLPSNAIASGTAAQYSDELEELLDLINTVEAEANEDADSAELRVIVGRTNYAR